mgnify:CR=1 FL=1
MKDKRQEYIDFFTYMQVLCVLFSKKIDRAVYV